MARSVTAPHQIRIRSGFGYLILALLAAGALSLAIFAGDQLRASFGIAEPPASLGLEPSLSRDSSGDTGDRELVLQPRGSDAAVDLRPERSSSPSGAIAPPTPPASPAITKADEQATGLLATARQHYRAFEWDAARAQAKTVLALNISSATRLRAEDILSGADALQDMFRKLDNREGLRRGWDTHPLLVAIRSGGSTLLAVPVHSLADPEVPETEDPVGYLQNRLHSRDGAAVRMAEGGGLTTLQPGKVSSLEAADVDTILAKKRTTFEAKLAEAEQGEFAGDPLMWYEAAKFAYINRLDERVTEMLDTAVALNPHLADAIREDQAHETFLKMVQSLDKDNRTQAAIWKGQLDKYYKETTVYPQALAYFKGNMQELQQAREQAVAMRQQQQADATAAARQRAEVLQDDAAAARLASLQRRAPAADVYAPPARPTAPLASGAAGDAETAMATGTEIYQAATNMTLSKERDNKYAEAQKYFTTAMQLYEQLGMTDKMVRANQLRYACIKYRRTF